MKKKKKPKKNTATAVYWLQPKLLAEFCVWGTPDP